MDKRKKLPLGFKAPTALPGNHQIEGWQRHNRDWWENNPMRYDWREGLSEPEFSPRFYQEIDRRFFEDAACYLPPTQQPFDEILPFPTLGQMDVLEIGVGSGSHAQLIAPLCRSYTGIDLTEYAVRSTRRRFECFGVHGQIHRMDAEDMEFADNSFDLVWSWGVIHHSANTETVLSEIRRVLRPGGRATLMVYHRSFLYFYVFNGLFRGVLGGGFLKTRSLHELVQLHTDGAIARFYRPSEWRALLDRSGFLVDTICIKGQKSELFPLPASRLKTMLMRATPNAASRFVLNTCRQGSFLITTLRKP